MSTRLRFLLVMFGAVLVGAAFTFDRWFPLVFNPEDIVLFPELPESLQEAFEALPAERREAYLELREENVVLAARMAAAGVQLPRLVPEDQQANPQYSGQVSTRSGTFIPISPIRSAEGSVTLYQLPDGSRYLWLEGFSVIPAPGLRLFLSAVNKAQIDELAAKRDPAEREYKLSLDDLLLDPLRFDVGNQAYDVPREADLSRYRSVIIYSTEFDLLWAYAPF
jgi:hypothetical protein